MGQAKKHYMELDEFHIYQELDKNICKNHFDELSINQFIKSISSTGICDYCNKRLKVADFNEVMEFIMESINLFYEDAGNFSSCNGSEGGYNATCYDVEELIEEVGLDANPYSVIEDVISCISDISWSKPDKYYGSEKDDIFYNWNLFKENIKHTSRFLFNSEDSEEIIYSYKTLEIIGNLISDYNLIKTIKAGTIIYRCHQHKPNEGRTTYEGNISAPNKLSKTSNRFSPAGISMFYCSECNDVSILEILNHSDIENSCITSAKFSLLKDIEVIDFSNLPNIPSIFGLENKSDFYMIDLLHDLVKDFTLPIEHDGREHRDYVPTQVVTEYLKFTFNSKRETKVEGIVYPSAKDKNKQSIVFFWNHYDCDNKVQLIDSSERNISTIKNELISLMYSQINIIDFNRKKSDPTVYKLELFSGNTKLKYLNIYYIQILPIAVPVNLLDIAKDLEPSCTTILASQNNIPISNTIINSFIT